MADGIDAGKQLGKYSCGDVGNQGAGGTESSERGAGSTEFPEKELRAKSSERGAGSREFGAKSKEL
jgi:hypothetical protein